MAEGDQRRLEPHKGKKNHNMSSHIIIDGHNYLMSGGERFSLAKKDDFIHTLRCYTAQKNVRITVVFDSRNPAGSAFSELVSTRLEVVYANYPEDADDVILRMIEHAGGETCVVSSDNKIIRGAKSRGAKSMKSLEFKKFIRSRGTKAQANHHTNDPGSEKPQHTTKAEMDYYLEQFQGNSDV